MRGVAFGFVLVGGKSRRMGEDKIRLSYRGRPMALHQAEKLAFVCGRAALVGKGANPFPASGYRFLDDEAASQAPIYGIHAALAWSPDDVNVILASDIPKCPESFLAALLEIAEAVPAAVVVPTVGGELQTLCSVWRKGALGALRESILAEQLSLRGPIERLRGIVIPENETARMPGGRAANFLNVNRQEDYEELQKESETHAPRP
jgi:molybdopterin-guanine dinucleotide biosynthesis protein A